VIIYIARRQAEGAKNATVNRETACLQRLFAPAIQAGTLTWKPYIPHLAECNNVRRSFVKDSQYDALARETERIGVWLRAILECGFVFGFRKSGSLRLHVGQLDFVERTIVLDASTTKNGKADRSGWSSQEATKATGVGPRRPTGISSTSGTTGLALVQPLDVLAS
jgi:hypothetical protein